MPMPDVPFEIERYFALHEHTAKHLLSSSDCEPLTLAETLELADRETRKMWERLSLGYTESSGLHALRREIASMYESLTADDVVEVVPEEGIFLAMNALLEKGDRVVVTYPAYQSLHAVAEGIGCKVSHWEPREAEGWRFDLDDLRALLRKKTKLVVVNFPHNPTGYLPSAADFRRIVTIVGQAGAILFSDEMYRSLEQDPARRLPSAADLTKKAIALSGVSKTLSLPGLRVGWLASRDRKLIARVAQLKDYTTICGSAPSEVLALIGLRARHAILQRNLGIIGDNLDALDAFVGAHPEFSWNRPIAGSIGLAGWDVEGGTRAACDRLAIEHGVMLLPSKVFGYGDAHVRFGFGRRAFAKGLKALAAQL
jgi:aspartate/methionine/tyrosine aminotransferase